MFKSKPEVLCSFITEFDDHIFVTVDADAFFFLHDLITSYVTEKEKVLGAQSARAASPNLSQKANLKPYLTDDILKEKQGASSANLNVQGKQLSGSKSSLEPLQGSDAKDAGEAQAKPGADGSAQLPSFDVESFVRDWRHFECQTWHLEPTVRLLSWAGKSIEPYGVDYILNKLGFSHARTTIPKWLQRGFMDPLDKVEALIMLQLLLMVRENKADSGSAKQNHRPAAN
ncbi:hypothetical protein ACLKA6_000830 [Drosophila palustris]